MYSIRRTLLGSRIRPAPCLPASQETQTQVACGSSLEKARGARLQSVDRALETNKSAKRGESSAMDLRDLLQRLFIGSSATHVTQGLFSVSIWIKGRRINQIHFVALSAGQRTGSCKPEPGSRISCLSRVSFLRICSVGLAETHDFFTVPLSLPRLYFPNVLQLKRLTATDQDSCHVMKLLNTR